MYQLLFEMTGSHCGSFNSRNAYSFRAEVVQSLKMHMGHHNCGIHVIADVKCRPLLFPAAFGKSKMQPPSCASGTSNIRSRRRPLIMIPRRSPGYKGRDD
ncbi:hypothetical protein EUGRSUZ_K00139 [Eucalyptus grandis]|uniref:Uncharacterized protein n=2 Tax=Eucalyptus grandis TaxID=71139 RepID=A0ACC3IRD8_EUCGR|nr:hypothetical protein EUGRSUZ_K00139 [Eucalyptus grandis]